MLASAAVQKFPNCPRSTSKGRSTHAIKAHVVGNASQNLCIRMLTQQHRQIAMTAQVKRDKNIFMPEDVDSLATNAERGVDGSIIEYGSVIKRAHPRANPFSSCEAAELDHGCG